MGELLKIEDYYKQKYEWLIVWESLSDYYYTEDYIDNCEDCHGYSIFVA